MTAPDAVVTETTDKDPLERFAELVDKLEKRIDRMERRYAVVDAAIERIANLTNGLEELGARMDRLERIVVSLAPEPGDDG